MHQCDLSPGCRHSAWKTRVYALKTHPGYLLTVLRIRNVMNNKCDLLDMTRDTPPYSPNHCSLFDLCADDGAGPFINTYDRHKSERPLRQFVPDFPHIVRFRGYGMPFGKINERVAYCNVVFRYSEHIAPGLRHGLIHHQLERCDDCCSERQQVARMSGATCGT